MFSSTSASLLSVTTQELLNVRMCICFLPAPPPQLCLLKEHPLSSDADATVTYVCII